MAVGRNDDCPCGSGKRYKHCHGAFGTGGGSAIAGAAAPPSPDALVRAAMAAHQGGDIEAAERGYRDALAVAPSHAVAMHYLGVVLYQRRQCDQALPLLERAVAAVPLEPEFHNNLGLALAAVDRVDDAIAAYRRALALAPDHAAAWNNLGLALQADNRLPDAIAAFREALARAPEFAQAHWNLSLALLANGEFEEGWREYEWRLRIPELARHERAPPGPRWDGRMVPGLRLLVTAEQGIGDALQFVRFARTLAAHGVNVLVSAPRPLVRLLATVPGVAAAVGPDDALPGHDAQVPIMSVPGAIGANAETLAEAIPYLSADPVRRAAIASSLVRRAGLLNVGLAWAGSRMHGNDRRRSIALALLAPLLTTAGVAWHSLQKDEAAGEMAAVPAAGVLTPLSEGSELDDTAALVAELDLVITVDTSLAHLAGALGRPVWILLPFAPDFRWQLGRADSPWYPTARLFRQPRRGDWDAVVREVARALQLLAAPP